MPEEIKEVKKDEDWRDKIALYDNESPEFIIPDSLIDHLERESPLISHD